VGTNQTKEIEIMSDDLINNRLGEINDDLADLNEWRDNVEARLARLEQYAVASKAAAIVAARTTPASPEAAKRGLVADEQTALINARASERWHTPVQPVKYGSRT
jgi:hypothetical protein